MSKTYYTYLHRRDDNGKVFYVGKGTGRRAQWKYHKDNKRWMDTIAQTSYSIEIIEHFTDKNAALLAELDLIHQHLSPWLTNKQVHISYLDPAARQPKSAIIKDKTLAKYDDLYDLLFMRDKFYAGLQLQPSGCIEPIAGSNHNQGYYMTGAVRKSDSTRIMTTGHRIVAREKYGRALDSKECVVHTCNNPKCCNPDHLTIADVDKVNQVAGTSVFVPKYDDQERQWIAHHELDEIMTRFNISKSAAAHARWDSRRRLGLPRWSTMKGRHAGANTRYSGMREEIAKLTLSEIMAKFNVNRSRASAIRLDCLRRLGLPVTRANARGGNAQATASLKNPADSDI